MPDDDLHIAAVFGKHLRQWRLEKNYCIQALARDMGVSQQVLSEWERGIRFPSQRNLEKIAHHTGVPLCTFFRDAPCPCNGAGRCDQGVIAGTQSAETK
jgi:transcriptional regulator with XRE-family HTH domain